MDNYIEYSKKVTEVLSFLRTAGFTINHITQEAFNSDGVTICFYPSEKNEFICVSGIGYVTFETLKSILQ